MARASITKNANKKQELLPRIKSKTYYVFRKYDKKKKMKANKRDLTGKHREEINIEIADEAKG